MTDTPQADQVPGQDTLPGSPDVPDAPPTDEPPKRKRNRPTTKADRAAQAEANRLRREAEKQAGNDKKPRQSRATSNARKSPLDSRLNQTIAQLGLVIMGVGAASGQPAIMADGEVIVNNAKNVSTALADVAKNNPKVAAALERMMAVSTAGALISALAPIGVGIAANHGLVPPQLAAQLGVELPTTSPAATPPGGMDGSGIGFADGS